MNVTQVALCPTSASQNAGRPALTPELLAATGARYSRSNEGLNAILAKIDPQNLDKSVDSIFRMVDYGHASIADMAPVAMFLDGVSMWLAYHVWSLSPTAGGQESSTRYIRLSTDNLPDADAIGIPETEREKWRETMEAALDAYETALAFWENEATQNPGVTRIPRELLEDSTEKAQKQVARMKRNYAFDRARYFLPASLKTNVMLVQSARAWVILCQNLLSHPLPEAQKLGELVRDELALAAPRLLKHAEAKPSFQKGLRAEWQAASQMARESEAILQTWWETPRNECHARLHAWGAEADGRLFSEDLRFHDNRYAYIGTDIRRTAVRFAWENVSFGDIRDLNRHRTGTKWCPFVPQGFYAATDQTQNTESLSKISGWGAQLTHQAAEKVRAGDDTAVYWILLGTQFPFEHTTTADKFLYEAELRTGTGAHYRYAAHLHDALELWYERFPETRGLVLEGSAEPE